MAVGIIYDRNNLVVSVCDKITNVQPNYIEFEGGRVDSIDSTILFVLVTNECEYGEEDRVGHFYIEGVRYNPGDSLPVGLTNIKDQFKKKTLEDLVVENEDLKNRLELTESALDFLILGGNI